MTPYDPHVLETRKIDPQVFSTGLRNLAIVLALLYLGRDVLIPISLAAILSLIVAPLVRVLRRLGLGQNVAVGVSGLGFISFLGATGLVIGAQFFSLMADLPQYEETIRAKSQMLREVTLGPIEDIEHQVDTVLGRRVSGRLDDPASRPARAPAARSPGPAEASTLDLEGLPTSPVTLLTTVAARIWAPLQLTGIVVVVLVFLLLDHENIRDRFVRLAGAHDLTRTTTAINDAGERLSRYFASQFVMNLGVGAICGLGLTLIGLPHALMWAGLTALLRFVPYIGVLGVAIAAAIFAAAVSPGWSLLGLTLGFYAVLETVTGQFVEPKLYGHTTGMSPLAVIVAAIFWSWLWGPVGLVVSIPLTLCLMVAGQHIKALGFLNILLGDAPALTMPQRFYQRALSGDSHEIIRAAKAYLKRRTFARYCDRVLTPALFLAGRDFRNGAITEAQQATVRTVVATVIEAIDTELGRKSRRYRRVSVLDDDDIAKHLRRQRELAIGQWQGPIAARPHSVVLGVGLGARGDDLAAEILVRVLRDLHIDARNVSMDDLALAPPPEASSESVLLVCLVNLNRERPEEHVQLAFAKLGTLLPGAQLALLLLEEESMQSDTPIKVPTGALVLNSFEAMSQHVVGLLVSEA
jgi:predicted PurR-regulated permease PerM